MMNALNFLAVGRGLESGKEAVGWAQSPDEGFLPLLVKQRDVEPERGSATAAGPAAGSVKSNRSMWRRFVGWIGRSDFGGQVGAGDSVVGQPELPSVDKSISNVSEIEAAKIDGSREGGRLSALASYNPFDRADKKVVQEEFRFENVRVVCNEMHDTDFIIKT